MNNSTNNKILEFIKGLYPNNNFIGLHEPKFFGNERKYVIDAIDSTFVSSVGKYVDRFEAMVKDFTGAKHAIAAVNGTAALHMSLILAGVEQGDFVITQPFSFIATCNAISYLKATPLFIDIDKSTLSLSYERLKFFLENNTIIKNNKCFEKVTGKKISACVPMHTFGIPGQIDQIVEICNLYNIPVIEDAAESLGSLFKNKHTGTFGLLGTYSFNGNKTITSGGGGVIITNDDKLALLAKHLTTQAKVPHKWEFNHDFIGYNYRMPNINAALACAQLEQLDKFIQNKRETASMYNTFFKNISEVTFISEPNNSKSNCWLNAILFNDFNAQQEFLEFSNSNGVMTRPGWNLLHTLPMYDNSLNIDLEVSENIFQRLVNLPSSVRV